MKTLKLLLLALIPLMASCANTKVTGSWKNPAVEKGYKPQKVLVVGMVPAAYREELEQQMVSDLKADGVAAVSSHEVLQQASQDADVEKTVRDHGFDTVLVTEFKGLKQDVTYTADGMGYGPYVHSYGSVVGSTSETAIMEASLFDANTGGKIWSATTRTNDPKNPSKEISKVVHVLVDRMEKDGLTM